MSSPISAHRTSIPSSIDPSWPREPWERTERAEWSIRGCRHSRWLPVALLDARGRRRTKGAEPGGRTPASGSEGAIYCAWSRLGETTAPLEVIENRFPTLFEARRMLYPRFAEFADPARYDQGIGGFLDHFQRPSFVAFAELAATLIGAPVTEVERADADGVEIPIAGELLSDVGTLVVISLDSSRTGQQASEDEIAALREFLDGPANLLVVAPHHNIGDDPAAECFHHGAGVPQPDLLQPGGKRRLLRRLARAAALFRESSAPACGSSAAMCAVLAAESCPRPPGAGSGSDLLEREREAALERQRRSACLCSASDGDSRTDRLDTERASAFDLLATTSPGSQPPRCS